MTTVNLNEKKRRFETIYSPGTAFGGVSFRVTSDGVTANLQEMAVNSNRFMTKRVMSIEDWRDLHSSYSHILNDPSWISNAIDEANEDARSNGW